MGGPTEDGCSGGNSALRSSERNLPANSEQAFKDELHQAIQAGNDERVSGLILAIIGSDLGRSVIKPWFQRLPGELHGETALFLAKVMRRHATTIAVSTLTLETDLRWMCFITAVCSQDWRVMMALRRGARKEAVDKR